MIKNIIFDIGGVLLDLDYELTFSKLSEVMGVDIDSQTIPAHIFKIMLGYEKGEINTETFLWNLQKESSNLTPPPEKLIEAWNAMLIGWNPKRFKFLEELQKKYSLFILSNTNELHLEWFNNDLKKNHNIVNFGTKFFKMAFYSHLMKMRKPEAKIFEQVQKEAILEPSETLFIDDNKKNVEEARKVGFYASYHNPKDEIIDCMKRYLDDHNQ